MTTKPPCADVEHWLLSAIHGIRYTHLVSFPVDLIPVNIDRRHDLPRSRTLATNASALGEGHENQDSSPHMHERDVARPLPMSERPRSMCYIASGWWPTRVGYNELGLVGLLQISFALSNLTPSKSIRISRYRAQNLRFN